MDILNKELVNHLSSGASLLVPTRRLALIISEAFNQIRAQEVNAWGSPNVFSLEDWCLALWQENESRGKIVKQLLNRQQSLLRFEEIIAEYCQGKMLQIGPTVQMAYAAWELLHHWLLLEEVYFKPENEEEEAFLIWAKNYQNWLDQHQLLDHAQLIKHLLPLLQNMKPKTLVLYGFEELMPSYVILFKQCQQWGWAIISAEPTAVAPNLLTCFAFPERIKEYEAAALWAKERLDQGKKRIAIVVPDLVRTRDIIETVFQETFEPLSICQPNAAISPHFNISAANALTSYPIIQALFAFLKLGKAKFSLQEYAQALTSCFTHLFEKEQYARNEHLLYLKTLLKEKTTAQACLRALALSHQKESLQGWGKILQKMQSLQKGEYTKASLSAWVSHFIEILACMGWPGERPLNSIEHQVVKRALNLLQELPQFEGIVEAPTYTKALLILQQLANTTLFQPENPAEAVQILGVLEAAGQTFEHLWITGMHHEAWPSMTRPNPFLPLSLQRAKQVPHACPERELQYCLKVTQRLQTAAKEVIFSYPQNEEGRQLDLTALLPLTPSSWAEMCKDFKIKEVIRCEALFKESLLDHFEDNQAPAITNFASLKANTNSVALMSACPFKAFAALRLEANVEKWPSIWLQAKDRGIILHRILEKFWQEFADQSQLKATPKEIVDSKMKQLITTTLKPFIHESASEIYISAEEETLLTILWAYLEAEKNRSYFRVCKTEAKADFRLGNFHFNLRLDRVDETENKERLIIDYKTGKFSINDIGGERPRAPQLPLYFLAAESENPKALMAIKLKSKGCEYTGVSETQLGIFGVSTLDSLKSEALFGLTWQDLAGFWQVNLLKLLENFEQGDASLAPLDGEATCQYCDYKPLCRIFERGSQ